MTNDEVRNYTIQGNVCVDIRLVGGFRGLVRSIIFYGKNRVCIEYCGYRSEEEWIEYCYFYNSLEQAISSIEHFLQEPISHWENYTKTGSYPPPPKDYDQDRDFVKLHYKVLRNDMDLPKDVPFTLNCETWKSITEFNEFLREQNLSHLIEES